MYPPLLVYRILKILGLTPIVSSEGSAESSVRSLKRCPLQATVAAGHSESVAWGPRWTRRKAADASVCQSAKRNEETLLFAVDTDEMYRRSTVQLVFGQFPS